ncbi:hypothetical protein COCCADRAFT_112129 [Bipolaris zeicola 26-R-13]|uniref:Uncharacterized protein n=1 Tax=Cochliobolus carbonum (strain 26-R-13) TaxID=930089 RepID=W6Y874_COCC2|nr:uncharacterized protein COCCADRAFT_112129 [Bipolaris zeicola 26-R-13]EUC27281.1 hypothetical protein COCCADRAFT_112129 [Bipolaris zeicola 26-R-13]
MFYFCDACLVCRAYPIRVGTNPYPLSLMEDNRNLSVTYMEVSSARKRAVNFDPKARLRGFILQANG